jgi:GT2 family glycosyltransferase
VEGKKVGSCSSGLIRQDVAKYFDFIEDSIHSGYNFLMSCGNEFSGKMKIKEIEAQIISNGQSVASVKIYNILHNYNYWLKKLEKRFLSKNPLTFSGEKPFFDIIILGESLADNSLMSEYRLLTENNLKDQDYQNFRLSKQVIDRRSTLIGSNSYDKSLKVKGASLRSHCTYMIFLSPEYALSKIALRAIIACIQENPHADLLYGDEDIIESTDKMRSNPLFKPGWSPDLIRSMNYIGGLLVISYDLALKSEIIKIDKISSDSENANMEFAISDIYEIILKASENTKQAIRIPSILSHKIEDLDKQINIEDRDFRNIKSLQSHISRLGISGKTVKGLIPETYKFDYDFDTNTKVSIIIPNKDNADVLKRCLDSIIYKSSYQNYEILIIENNSTYSKVFDLYDSYSKNEKIKIIVWKDNFNYSGINNFAARQATGSMLLFLNNDTEVINSSWLERLLEHACRSEIGAVGAKLYYPDGKIQHAGVILGIGYKAAGHPHRNSQMNADGYGKRLKVVKNVSAVTGACLMIDKKKFFEVGGFDERFVIALNDIDLCLKLFKKEYLNIWTPFSELYHYEYLTRGVLDTPEKEKIWNKEVALFKQIWGEEFIFNDKYYNPNLSLDTEQFMIKI